MTWSSSANNSFECAASFKNIAVPDVNKFEKVDFGNAERKRFEKALELL